MLSEIIAHYIGPIWGPIRILESIVALAAFGAVTASLLTLFALPRVWHLGTRDKGRNHAHNAEASIGKPLGVGIFMCMAFCFVAFLFVGWDLRFYLCVAALMAASLVGFIDDAKPGGLSELTLGVSDLCLSIVVCACIFYGTTTVMWIPLTSISFSLPFWAAMIIFVPVVWISINALNCNDGVDGLSGLLSATTIATLGLLLYFVIGNSENAEHLLVPFKAGTTSWVIASAIMCGALMGYLWHNAPPSAALMGDAGSRPLGMLIGILVAVSGNPLLLLVVAPVILVNGATGLLKVAIIRVLRVRILSSIRFPLHDHVRKSFGWSNSQVLIRFFLLHLGSLVLLILLLFKVR